MVTTNVTPWIETFTGKHFDLLVPTAEMISIVDIAHALSQQCRFTGHTKVFYSVAEHSIHVSQLAEDKLWGLLHDASEAYLCDLSRPIKHATPIGPPYVKLEASIMQAICLKYGLSNEMPSSVRKADNQLLFTEKEQLMTKLSWTDDSSSNQLVETSLKIELNCWEPLVAEQTFLHRFYDLTEGQYAD